MRSAHRSTIDLIASLIDVLLMASLYITMPLRIYHAESSSDLSALRDHTSQLLLSKWWPAAENTVIQLSSARFR